MCSSDLSAAEPCLEVLRPTVVVRAQIQSVPRARILLGHTFDHAVVARFWAAVAAPIIIPSLIFLPEQEIGRASCRERVQIPVVAVALKKQTNRHLHSYPIPRPSYPIPAHTSTIPAYTSTIPAHILTILAYRTRIPGHTPTITTDSMKILGSPTPIPVKPYTTLP